MRVATVSRVRKNILDGGNEAFSYADRIACIFRAYPALRPGFVVSGFLEVIGGSKIAREPAIQSCIFVGELMKLDLHASMSFRNPIGALENQRLRGVELGIIRKPRRLPGNADREDGFGVLKRFSSIRKIGGGLGFHRSTPSLRISCISGEEVLRQLSAG